MSSTSLMLCERCGTEGATPTDVAIANKTTKRTVSFVLCPDCQTFAESVQPLQSEDEITGDSEWMSRIDPILDLANQVATMQHQIDQLRVQITEKKKVLKLKVRSLDGRLNDGQWARMIEEQQLSGESSAVFWLEKYRRR